MKIFIDAGHNPNHCDLGACGNGIYEHDMTFKISQQLAKMLQEIGAEVKQSRENDSVVLGSSEKSSLAERVAMANNWSADCFISIHCNAFALSNISGTECYVYSHNSELASLGDAICRRISETLGVKDRGVKAVGYYVLKNTKMPAILIETAFITNPDDAKKLKNNGDAFATAIFDSICERFKLNKEAEKMGEATYHTEGKTHIVEVDPARIWAVETQKPTHKTAYNNFVNSVFFMAQKNGSMYPQGIMVNGGKVLCNNPTHGKPVATLIVHGAKNVEMKYITDITKENDVWFAVSGYGIYPNVTAAKEGFVGKFSDVTRATDRPIIGYRKADNKIVIAVRSGSDAERAKQTAKNLKLDFAISLDGGGSTTLKINGVYKFKGDGRKLYGGLTWA